MKKFLHLNGLSIVFFLFFLFAFFGQSYSGFKEYNYERMEAGASPVSFSAYFSTGHFLQATFENWESEFLQMALFVWLTIFLYQKGSSESKKPGGSNKCDEEPDPKKKQAPWPVRRGGFILKLYKNSLTLILLLLFIISFVLHFYGSLRDHNEQAMLRHESVDSAFKYLSSARFWFESFQNWQSEFLSIFAIVILSIYFRQQGSPQSKAVDAPHSETGE